MQVGGGLSKSKTDCLLVPYVLNACQVMAKEGPFSTGFPCMGQQRFQGRPVNRFRRPGLPQFLYSSTLPPLASSDFIGYTENFLSSLVISSKHPKVYRESNK